MSMMTFDLAHSSADRHFSLRIGQSRTYSTAAGESQEKMRVCAESNLQGFWLRQKAGKLR